MKAESHEDADQTCDGIHLTDEHEVAFWDPGFKVWWGKPEAGKWVLSNTLFPTLPEFSFTDLNQIVPHCLMVKIKVTITAEDFNLKDVKYTRCSQLWDSKGFDPPGKLISNNPRCQTYPVTIWGRVPWGLAQSPPKVTVAFYSFCEHWPFDGLLLCRCRWNKIARRWWYLDAFSPRRT